MVSTHTVNADSSHSLRHIEIIYSSAYRYKITLAKRNTTFPCLDYYMVYTSLIAVNKSAMYVLYAMISLSILS